MGQGQRAALPLVALVALAGAASLDWWSSDAAGLGGEVTVRASLLGVRVCSAATCLGAPAPSGWAILGPVALIAIGLTALGAAAAAWQLWRGGDADATLTLAARAAAGAVVAALMASADAVFSYQAMPSWGPAGVAIGAVLLRVARTQRALDDGFGAARSARPVPVAPAGDLRAPGPRAGDPRAATAPRPRADGLRFVARAATITAAGLDVELDGGGTRALAWADVARIAARRLPPDPPHEKAALLDLVPAAGPPVRLTADTRVDYARLPGGAAPGTKENWRRLAALARAANPAVELDPDSAPFWSGGEPPMFPAMKPFLAWDARYDAT